MATLHARLNSPSSDPVMAAKGVRAALRALGMPDASFDRAWALVEMAQCRGLVLVAMHGDEDALVRAQGEAQRAAHGHMAFYVNMRPEAQDSYTTPAQRELRAVPDPDRDGRTPATRLRPVPEPPPEPNAAATMAVMMAVCNGNPLIAAAHCQNLARTAACPVFLVAKALLIEGFPWIEAKLDAGEIA